MIGCWAITEPHHGSDTLIVGTPDFHNPRVNGQVLARRDGDHYVISGQKAAWVSNGTLATHAALYCTTEPVHGMAGGGIAFVPLEFTRRLQRQAAQQAGAARAESRRDLF